MVHGLCRLDVGGTAPSGRQASSPSNHTGTVAWSAAVWLVCMEVSRLPAPDQFQERNHRLCDKYWDMRIPYTQTGLTIVETANGKAYSWYLARKKGGMESVSWGGAHHFLLLKVILYERLTLCLVCCFNITYYWVSVTTEWATKSMPYYCMLY